MKFFEKYKKPEIVTIVCDWFEVSGEAQEMFLFNAPNSEFETKSTFTTIINDRVAIVWQPAKATSTYAKIFEIYIGTVSFGKLFIEPRMETLDKKRVNVQVNNEWLYTESWYQNFEEIMSALKISLTNISRLDIAVDGCNQILEFVSGYIKQEPEKQKVIKVGQAKLSPFKLNDKTFEFETINLGSRRSEKFCVMYHKSKELKRHNSKRYINDFWYRNGIGKKVQINGIDCYVSQDNINRVEMRYTSKYLEHYPELVNDMSVCQDPQKLAMLFFRSTERYFDFRLNNSKHVDKCKKIELIPVEILRTSYLTKIEIPIRDYLFATKVGLKANTLFILNGHANEMSEAVRLSIQKTLEQYGLHEWYMERFPLWQAMSVVSNRTGHVYDIEYMLRD